MPATRRDVRDAINAELAALAGDYVVTYDDDTTATVTLAAENIGLTSPSNVEERPAIVYTENYVPRTVNEIGGPSVVNRDTNGDVTSEENHEYRTAIYDIFVVADSEVAKEPIYEALARQFGKFQFVRHHASSLHHAIESIRVDDASSDDYTEEDTAIRGDSVTVEVDFHRVYEQTDDEAGTIETVDAEVDADTDDQTPGEDYTIN